MYKSYIPYLQHILDECLYVRSVITDEMEIDQFLSDETLKRALRFLRANYICVICAICVPL